MSTGSQPDTSLLKEQYSSSNNLEARIRLHQLFSTNPYGWYRWYMDHVHLPAGAQVLELGCGPGSIWTGSLDKLPAGARLALTDYSPGMARQARQNLPDSRFSFSVVDAQNIPFESGRFDAVIANHMLYHVPDRDRAIREIRRVLKPGGTFYAATNGEKHLVELYDLVDRLAPALNYRSTLPHFSATFTLQNAAAQLSRHFSQVSLEAYPDGLAVTQAQPLVDYIFSMIGFHAAFSSISTDQRENLRSNVEEEIQAKGVIHITKEAGLFISS